MSRVLLLALVSLMFACGPGPKGTQLVELERLLQDPGASDVKKAPGASKSYKDARKYRRLSLEAWEDGNKDRSEEYALLGWLKYRTAEAISEQSEAKVRLDAANAKVAEINPELQAINNEQMKLTAEVAALEKRVALARSNNKSVRLGKNTEKGDPNALSKFNAKLIETEKAKNGAEGVNAQKHAQQTWARANNQLKSVRAEFDGSNRTVRPEMIRDLETAIILFNKAKSEATSGFANDKAKADPSQRRQNLSAALKKDTDGTVSIDGTTVRAIFPGSFSSGGSSPNASLRGAVEKVAKLLSTYDEFSVRIEGYTDRGDATENLGLSQLRAKAVADILSANGVPGSKIDQKGKGQDLRRFSGSQNDRVEIVFY